ncbi:hypothetical protein L3N51_01650 [Metallosphaera sp. J1]|uniref:hypothetical protein n=1 Tax=Metallosphaera javensis (ex Hofmann et al. 2022) TaxID=99938 RepID=UPI001EDD3FD9|nr:hypothetical protein [Metallosphaera javensis (ex Hofmann et al. 2022)]MCG3109360.1 hypothetical protein [Metallosphaera javensis (ex Hofmann et al. 2022)]
MRICGISEDTYGCEFIRGILEKLKSLRRVDESAWFADCYSVRGKQNVMSSKTERILKRLDSKCDKILIFVDRDDDNLDDLQNSLNSLERVVGKNKIHPVIFDPEIEEWIKPDDPKPSQYLKQHMDYDKSNLPRMVDTVPLDLLERKRSFQDFLGAVTDP